MARAFRGHEGCIDPFRGDDLVEVQIEAVRAHQERALLQIRLDLGLVDVPLDFVGEQNIDEIALLGRFRD